MLRQVQQVFEGGWAAGVHAGVVGRKCACEGKKKEEEEGKNKPKGVASLLFFFRERAVLLSSWCLNILSMP